MTIESETNDTPDIATPSLPLGKFDYAVDSLWGSVGRDGDVIDHFLVQYTGQTQTLDLTSFGLWHVAEFMAQSGVVGEYRWLTIKTVTPGVEGPTIRLTAEHGYTAGGFSQPLGYEGLLRGIETCETGLADPDSTNSTPEQLQYYLDLYRNALGIVDGAIDSQGSTEAAAAQLRQMAEDGNSFIVRDAADFVDQLDDQQFVVTVDGVSQPSDTPPSDYLAVFNVPLGLSGAVFEITGGVAVYGLEEQADGSFYRLEDMDYTIDFTWSGPVGPTEFDDDLTGEFDRDDTVNLLAGNDRYLGLGGNDTINGESGNDVLDGGAGNDILNGGIGGDQMFGGAGNDQYWVQNADDTVDESVEGSSGTDIVNSAINFSLSSIHSKGDVENLTLIGLLAKIGNGNSLANTIRGTTRDNALGGLGGADVLIGNAGNDILNGGAGADRMYGGAGNDIYLINEAGDVISEALDGSNGIDTVLSSITFSLVASARLAGMVEHLTLTGGLAINGIGNAAANRLVGNTAANVLNGGVGNDLISGGAGNDTLLGGLGVDTLTGGAGRDTFRFAGFGASTVDRVTDFVVADDTIQLDNDAMTALGARKGLLGTAMFHASAAGVAHDADDRIIYDTDSGALIYDANGNRTGGAVLIARLSAGLGLTAADFIVI